MILANKERVTVKSVGDVSLILNVNNRKIATNVRNVEYVPNLCANLLSVRQITKQNKRWCSKAMNVRFSIRRAN